MRFLEFALTFNNVALIQWSFSSDLAVPRLFYPFERALSALHVVGLVWGFSGCEFLHDVLQGAVHFDWCGSGWDGGVFLATWLARVNLIYRLCLCVVIMLPLLFSDLVPLVPYTSTTSAILLLTSWLYLILKLGLTPLTHLLSLSLFFHRNCSKIYY